MGHLATFESITLHITTDQSTTHFTVETMFPGVVNYGFNETSPGVYSRNETAHNGSFTEIILPFGDNGGPNIAVLNDGSSNETERRKGVFIEAETGHELTVYATGFDTPFPTIGTYMAIACAEFTVAKYEYFVFTLLSESTNNDNQILITPCEDNTRVSVRPSRAFSHPDWVNPSHGNTDPTSTSGRDVSEYGRLLNRFDTLMLSSEEDLTGSIIISDKPLSVLVRSHSVTQIPPHPTYGDLFVLPNVNKQSLVIYAIGSLTDGVRLSFFCNCTPPNNVMGSVTSNNEVEIGNDTAVVNRGQFVQCFLPTELDMCIVQSSQPVIAMVETVQPQFISVVYLQSIYNHLIDSQISLLGNVKPNVESATYFFAYLFWLDASQSEERCSRSIRTDSDGGWISYCMEEPITTFETIIRFENIRAFGGGVFLQYFFQNEFQLLPPFSLPFKMDPVGCKPFI